MIDSVRTCPYPDRRHRSSLAAAGIGFGPWRAAAGRCNHPERGCCASLVAAGWTALIAAAAPRFSAVITWPEGRTWADLTLSRISSELLGRVDALVAYLTEHYWGGFEAVWVVELSETDGRPHVHMLLRRDRPPRLRTLRRAADDVGLGNVRLQEVRFGPLNMAGYIMKEQLFGLTLPYGQASAVASFAIEANGGQTLHHTPGFFGGPDGAVAPDVEAAAVGLVKGVWRWTERKDADGTLRAKMPARLLARIAPVHAFALTQREPFAEVAAR